MSLLFARNPHDDFGRRLWRALGLWLLLAGGVARCLAQAQDDDIPANTSVQMIDQESTATLELEAQAGLGLRLIDGTTSQPLAGVLVNIDLPVNDRAFQTLGSSSAPRTDAQGYLRFDGLASGSYALTFPELKQARDEWLEEASDSAALGAGSEAVRRQELRQRKPKPKPEPVLYCLPEMNVAVRDGAVDLRSVVLQRVPLATIEIRDEQGRALSGFPFELSSGSTRIRKWTDATGQARIQLAGFSAGQAVHLCAPAPLNEWFSLPGPQEDRQKPEHPNHMVAHPRPGEAFRMALTYRPLPEDVALELRFVDATTSRPLANASGLVGSERDDWRYAVDAPQGVAQLPHVTLAPNLVATEYQLAEKERRQPGSTAEDYERRRLNLLVDARAPGYAPRTFYLPLAELRAGRIAPLALEPGAVVHGRIRFAPGLPFTTESLRTLLQKRGVPQRGVQDSMNAFTRQTSLLVLENSRLEGPIDFSRLVQYVSFFVLNIQPDGSFSTDRLRPASFWQLRASLFGLPPVLIKNITIHPGENDLGEIYLLPQVGSFQIKVTDETGQPVPGARLHWVLEQGDVSQARETDGGGQLSSLMTGLTQGARQLLQLDAPWGLSEHADAYERSRISYECQAELPGEQNHTLSATLQRGHTLTVHVPASAASGRWAAWYAQTERLNMDRHPRIRTAPYAAIGGAALLELGRRDDEWRYYQRVTLNGGLRLSTTTQQLVLHDVPPGRLALRLDGGGYNPELGKTEPLPPETTFPLAYQEFEMPDRDTTLDVALNDTDVEVVLDAPPFNAEKPGPYERLVLLEREAPRSSYDGNPLRESAVLIKQGQGAPREAYFMPLVSYWQGFITLDREGHYRPQPALFLAVPPGRYTLSVWKDPMALIDLASQPLWRQPLEVPVNGGKITVHYKPGD